jgi:DNA-binding transcriptional regulator YiaG
MDDTEKPDHKRSEGARALYQWSLDRRAEGTQSGQLAALIGVGAPTLAAWLRGARTPQAPARELLRRVAGVDPAAWDRP